MIRSPQLLLVETDSRKAPSPRLAAVVLNFRTPEQTSRAVESLLESRRIIDEVIVVDNDRPRPSSVSPLSTYAGDQPPLKLRRSAGALAKAEGRYGVTSPNPGSSPASAGGVLAVTCLSTGKNLGFSGGMNVGIRAALQAGADRVLLVNSDVTVPPDCVERLEHCLESTPNAGIVGPVVVARSNPSQVLSTGMSYSDATGRMRHRGFSTPVASLNLPECSAVDAVAGCLMLISGRVFDAVGLFDEDYFFSFEDLDFCLKARRTGFMTMLAGGAIAYHEGAGTIGPDSPRRFYFAARNHLLASKRSGTSNAWMAHLLRVPSIVLLNIAHALTSQGGSRAARLWAVLRGTKDYAVGRFGEG